MTNPYPGIQTVRELDIVSPHLDLGSRHQGYLDKHKPKIAAVLGELERALKRLSEGLQEAEFAVVYEPVYSTTQQDVDGKFLVDHYQKLGHGPALEAAVSAYCTLELGPDDSVNQPVRCHGAIGAGPRIIDLAEKVNEVKTKVQATFKPLTNYRIPATVKVKRKEVVKMIPISLYILRQLQKSSLNRLGAYRSIPLIRTAKGHPPTPLAIRFTEAWTRSLVRRTVNELIAEAADRRRDDLVGRLERCGVDGNEYVYCPKKPYLRMRANLWFPGATEEQRRPKNYQAEMPILFLLKSRDPRPKCTPPRPRDPNSKRSRKNIPLKEQPIYPSSKDKSEDYTSFYQRANAEDRERAAK